MNITNTIPVRFREQPPTSVVRVMQTSDWHIGGIPTMATLDRAQLRREQLLRDVESLPAIARECKVDVVLLPGDLFQNEDIANADVERTMAAIRAFAPIPVIIAAGNHDPLDALSQYHRRLLLHHAAESSTSVYVAGGTWQRFPFERFAVTARSFVSQAVKTDSPFHDLPPRGNSPIELVCLHGSVGEPVEGQERTAPVTELEIAEAGYDYTALGHYHHGREYRNEAKLVIAGYSGCLGAIRKSDNGECGILLLDVESGGVQSDAYCRIRIDPARFTSIQISDEPITNALLESVIKSFKSNSITPLDFVRITITGRRKSQRRDFPSFDTLANLCFACEWNDETIPEWDWEQLSTGNTVEARFVRELRTQIEQARTDGDETQAILLNDALDLALQALQEKEIKRLPPSLSHSYTP